MVTSVTSFSRSGLSDFVVQRVSAVILGVYMLCVIGFLLANPDLTYEGLVAYFGSFSMQMFTTLTIFATAAHAWIGMWTIGTDYIQPHYFGKGATTWRFLYQSICVFTLFIYVGWALRIFWSL
ncbi:MAG: succinate dehydrogenase, hydrophobic membrane anchor protein [Proteobacteria bacterium]|nr:succinate dehydrogenase, hydrophobic membrane anchor protein [Pseudomonadota bacterium]